MNSSVSLASAILGGIVGYGVGYGHRAVWQAFADLKGQKAKIPGLRKDAWGWAWTMAKRGTVVAVVGGVLAFWLVRDIADGPAKTPLAPSRAPTAPPSKGR